MTTLKDHFSEVFSENKLSYDLFVDHIMALLLDCNFVIVLAGNFSPWGIRESADPVKFNNEGVYQFIEYSNPEWYNVSTEEEFISGSNFAQTPRESDNVVALFKLEEGELTDALAVYYLGKQLFKVGDVLYDDMDALDAKILKWVLS